MAEERLMHTAQRGETEGSILSVEEVSLELPNGEELHPILRNISFTVNAGEFIAVFGPSGSGKSTLLRLVAGLIGQTSGEVRFNPDHLRSERPFGFVFQEPRLLPWRRIAKNVEFGLEGMAVAHEERRRRAEEALTLVGLSRYGSRWPYQLSGGQRQRVGIARAVAVRPDLLLMDEPFSSLDAVTRRTLQSELLRIWRTTESSILFVTHDLEEAILLADRLVLLAGSPGELVREYRIDEERPHDPGSPGFRELLREVRGDLAAASDGPSSLSNPLASTRRASPPPTPSSCAAPR